MRPKVGSSKKNAATILSRALELKDGDLPPDGERFILKLGIRKRDKKRLLELLAKHQKGQIAAGELDVLESYVQADDILSILKAQAVLALNKAEQKP
jgi:hypothetical protein